MKLNKLHYEIIKMLAEGETKTKIAEKCGVARQTIIKWLKDEDFFLAYENEKYRDSKAAINHLNRNCQRYIKEIEEIAFNGKSEKNRMECLKYLTDRVLGNTVQKVEQSQETQINVTSEEVTDEPKSIADIIKNLNNNKEPREPGIKETGNNVIHI